MSDVIKLSSPATKEFWEIPVLFEDEHLLAISKPDHLLSAPENSDLERPDLMKLLHHDIERGAGWAKKRSWTYLMNAHRLDFETTGVLLLAKTKPVHIALADQFGSDRPTRIYVALVRGNIPGEEFFSDASINPHPLELGLMRVDQRDGKKSRTDFIVRERFTNCTLLECRPRTARTHQIRVHLKHIKLPLIGDAVYGSAPLLLSSLKSVYRLKPGHEERPLLDRAALHAEQLILPHPITGAELKIEAPWPKDLTVAIKYLRRYSAV